MHTRKGYLRGVYQNVYISAGGWCTILEEMACKNVYKQKCTQKVCVNFHAGFFFKKGLPNVVERGKLNLRLENEKKQN